MCKIFIQFLEKIPSPYAPETIWRAAIRTPRGWVFIVIRKRIGYDYQLNKMPSLEEQEI